MSEQVSFVEWYEAKYKEKWHEDYVLLYSFAFEVTDGYTEYCKENNINPIWNG